MVLEKEKEQIDQNVIDHYTRMQKGAYKDWSHRPDIIVGHYGYHENVPYETLLLHIYGDMRRPIFNDFHNKRAFEICCGEGRMVRRMQKLFAQVDGADISEEMIDFARERTPGSEFWITDGQDCGGAPTSAYDFVYCTISLQHICVFEVRDRILKDVMRILKPDGKITFQYLFSKDFPFLQINGLVALPHLGPDMAVKPYQRNQRHAAWNDNLTQVHATNSEHDVLFGENDIGLVKDYFKQYFHEVEIWFHDISIGRGDFGKPRMLDENHPNSHTANTHIDDKKYHGTHFAFIHLSGRRDR
jgi:ubiquinone/menaquinone biosynthesis C-methylase UbiE